MNKTENSSVAAELFVDPPSTDVPNQACKHSLANTELNEFLYIYEEFIRSRFSAIKNTIKTLSIYQHDLGFVTHAKSIAIDRLHYELPANLLEDSWVAGLRKCVYFSYAQQNALPPDNLNDRKMITKLSVVLSLIAALFLNGCNHAEHETHHELPKLEATTPFRKDVSLPRQYVGLIEAIMHIEIRALEKGYLERIFVDEGQWIKKGQPMFELMAKVYQAEFETAKAEAQFAKIEYLNTKGLADENIVSPNELALAKAKLDKANAKVMLMQTRLGFTDIRAPFDGIMGRFHARIGSLLNEGDLLTELSDIRQLWVYFNVPEADYLNFKMEEGDKLGEAVQLKMANGEIYEHTGVIERIVGDFDNSFGTIQFRALFPNPDKILRHDETGTILLTKHYPNALIIPQKAVFEIMDKNYVYVINEEEKLEQRLIHIEAEMTKLFLIKEGLDESDRVLLEGIRRVSPGDKVSINLRPHEEIVPELELYTE